MPLAVVEQVFTLYREKYFDFNVRHFHEKQEQEQEIRLSYTSVKKALPRGRPGAPGAQRGMLTAQTGNSGRMCGRGLRTSGPELEYSVWPHVAGRYNTQGWPCLSERKLACLPLRLHFKQRDTPGYGYILEWLDVEKPSTCLESGYRCADAPFHARLKALQFWRALLLPVSFAAVAMFVLALGCRGKADAC